MVKTELVLRIVKRNPKLSPADCQGLIEAFFETMIDHLSQDGVIVLRGFGTFAVKRYKERVVRNPRTGATLLKGEPLRIRFRTGKSLAASLSLT